MLFLTGNENKVREARQLLGIENIKPMSCDLVEIQSTSVEEVSLYKVKQAANGLSEMISKKPASTLVR